MSRNEFKRSTGYYTLRILRATGVDADAKELFVEVRVKDSLQRTRVIQGAADAWNETLPIRVAMGKTLVSLSLLRRSRVFPFSRTIGICRRAILEIVKQSDGREEMAMELTDSGRTSMSRLTISLDFSDVQENATVALYNLLSLVNDDGELPLGSDALENTSYKVEQLVEEGKAVMRARSIRDAIPQIDNFVDFVDNVAQAHPLLNLGWQLVAALYKVTSDQLKLDKRVDSLLKNLILVFDFAEGASQLAGEDDGLTVLRRIIIKLLDQLVECSIFIREYARRKFLKRVLRQAGDKEKMRGVELALQALRKELNDGINLQVAFYIKDIVDGNKKSTSGKRSEKALKGQNSN